MFDEHNLGRRRPRLTDIARRAGVSVATVSNVLNKKGRMSRETVDRVMRILDELSPVAAAGTPGAAAVNGSVLLASVDPGTKVFQSYLHLRLLEGMQSILEEEGIGVSMADYSDPEAYRRAVRRFRAAVLVGFPDDPDNWAGESPVPVVWALRTTARTGDVVQEDNREIGAIAAEYLLGLGHRVVGYLDDSHIETLAERRWFLERALARHGGRLVAAAGKNLFNSGPDGMSIDQPQTARLIREIVKAKPRPTALFIPGDRLCFAVYSILTELGMTPQQDLHILSCNNEIPILSSMTPRPASVGMNIDAIGRRAAETVLWRLRNPSEPPVRVLVRPHLVLPPS
ncbi:MAG: LacI family transcriptional regulator [Planctomycetaceae bacterium]|nr:LacI family transcriptional regulator [Planctomycetaceae bacterium]